MRTAYAILGLTLIAILAAALFFIDRAEAPRTVPSAALIESNLPQTAMMTLSSPMFENNGTIPSRYSCDGEGGSPELLIEGVPSGAQSLVLLMDDPDIPEVAKEKLGISVYQHWTLFNIPGTTRTISENSVPEGAVVGENSSGASVYRGPCPPDGEHRYFFKLYALDRMLELRKEATAADVRAAMEGHILEQAELLGRYARTSSPE